MERVDVTQRLSLVSREACSDEGWTAAVGQPVVDRGHDSSDIRPGKTRASAIPSLLRAGPGNAFCFTVRLVPAARHVGRSRRVSGSVPS